MISKMLFLQLHITIYFAFLSATLEYSGTFTITTNMIVLRSLFTQILHKDQCKQALQYGS